MATYYAAVDMGASSGRLILGHMEKGKMELEEIHRFENGMVKKDGELCWEFDRIFTEIVAGLKKCKEIGKIPVSMGVDTWGVDFVLLDKEDKVLGNTVGYRDQELVSRKLFTILFISLWQLRQNILNIWKKQKLCFMYRIISISF